MSYMLEALSGSVQASALDLSQNGIATLEFQDQHRRLHHVSTLLVGRLGDLWEWIVLNHQHESVFMLRMQSGPNPVITCISLSESKRKIAVANPSAIAVTSASGAEVAIEVCLREAH